MGTTLKGGGTRDNRGKIQLLSYRDNRKIAVCAKSQREDMAAAATETVPKDATEDPKLDVFEDDDEFEEFENEDWDDKEEGKEVVQQWEDEWDDDDVTDDFSIQLRKELESATMES